MCSVLRSERLAFVQTILPKGACLPLLDTPRRWRDLGIEPHRTRATSGRCIASQGRRSCSPDTPMTNLIAVGSRPVELPRSPDPIGQGGRFRSPPCSPHRPTLRGLDARSFRLMVGYPEPQGIAGYFREFGLRRLSRRRSIPGSWKCWRHLETSHAVRGRPCGSALETLGYSWSLLPPWLGGRPVRPLRRPEQAQDADASVTPGLQRQWRNRMTIWFGGAMSSPARNGRKGRTGGPSLRGGWPPYFPCKSATLRHRPFKRGLRARDMERKARYGNSLRGLYLVVCLIKSFTD
jgi:hypothetical protein